MTWLGGDLRRRDYATYPAYCAHQGRKLDRMRPSVLAAYEARYEAALRPRLAAEDWPRGSRVLCLGARGGAEVRVFLSLGCLAVGLDLNPGPGNPHVMSGDFHALPFRSGTVDVVFTNALDHAYDMDLALEEAHRVLAPAGSLIVEAVYGTREGGRSGSYESVEWETIDALVHAIARHGFAAGEGWLAFDCPWPGEHLVFQRTEAAC